MSGPVRDLFHQPHPRGWFTLAGSDLGGSCDRIGQFTPAASEKIANDKMLQLIHKSVTGHRQEDVSEWSKAFRAS